MRNLKKFLALVLAMMMVFSLMATVNATSFPDDGNISDDYRQAVEVLSAIKVFKGNDDGKLNPKDPIKRAEFATVLYRIATGDVDGKSALLNTMADYDQFSDVNANSYPWASRYINYAAQAGWLVGDEGIGGTYRPEDNVTVYQVLVALLRVLELGDGITSDNWQFQTAMKAGNIGLYEGLEDGAMGGYATREMIAQLALNAMTYVPGENGKAGQPVVKWALEGVTEHFNTTTEAESYATQNGMGKAGEEGGPAIEKHTVYPDSLAFNNFDHLHKVEGGRDDFERPTISWNTEKEAVVVENYLEPDYPVYYGTFTGKDAKALKKNVKNADEDIHVYYNGGIMNDTGNPTFQEDKTSAPDESGLWWDDNTGIKGYEVWVYKMGSGYDIIVREAYAAQVSAATKAGNPITVDVYEMGSINEDASWSLDNPTQTFTVKKSDDEDLYNTLSAFKDEAYIGVYAKAGFDDYTDGDDNPADFLLEIATLTEVPDVVINHIQDKEKKTLSTILVNNSAASYGINNEAMWTDGEDAWYGNVVRGDSVEFMRATQLGVANLHLLNGNILIVEQPEATRPGVHYAYLLDYKAINGANAPDAWTPDWASDTDVVLQLKIMLDDGTVIDNIYYMDWGTEVCDELWAARDGDGPETPEAEREGAKKAHLFANKTDAEAVGDLLLNRLFVYDTRYGNLLTLIDENYDTTDWDFEDTDPRSTDFLYNPGYGKGVTGYMSAGDPGEGAEENVSVTPGVAKGFLDDEEESVIFDTETIFFVTENLSAKGKKNADVKIYHGILDPDLPELKGGDETFVQYVLDKKTEDEGSNKARVIAVLISLPGKDDDGDGDTTEDTYFIVGYDTATLHKRYTEAYHGEDTPYIEYYEFWAIKNGTEKVAIEANEDFDKTDIAWGEAFELDDNKLFTDTYTDFVDVDTTITGIKWTVLHNVINVTTADDEITGYVITKDTKVWFYDEDDGSINAIDPFKITEDMVGYVHTDDKGKLVALYLYIPTAE